MAADGGAKVSVGAWEGPLDLLVEEARRRRVDLAKISLSQLVDACLELIARIPSTSEKADQLIIAATLAEMKARLLLPGADDDDELEEERLRARLLELERIKELGSRLLAQDALGRDVFARGAPEFEPETRTVVVGSSADLDLLELVRAYARLQIIENADAPLEIRRIFAMTLKEGLEALGHALPADGEWADLVALAGAARRGRGVSRKSAIAANFVAALEMAREGRVELKQDETLGRLVLRRM